LLLAGYLVPVKQQQKKRRFFCGFFTGKPPVKNPLAGQTSDFQPFCGKILMVNFPKENNAIVHRKDETHGCQKKLDPMPGAVTQGARFQKEL
jgi:hypothetical protein